MSDRLPTPAPTATWRLADTTLLAREADAMLRQNLLLINAAGFLIGYYAMFNQWLQLGWFLTMTGIWFWAGGFQDFMQSLRRDWWLVSLVGLTFLLLARSTMVESPGVTIRALWYGWCTTGLLIAVMMMLWQAGAVPRAVHALSFPLVLTASTAAAGSVLMFNLLDSRAMIGARLSNWFIYGGWNSVCTGMTFGFAALWAVYGWMSAATRRHKNIWLAMTATLIMTTLMTMSRGALLALLSGHVGLIIACGWRRALKPGLLLLGCIVTFQFSAPLISSLATHELSQRTGVSVSEITPEMFSDSVIAANPAARVIERADNGRFLIYDAALQSMTTWQDWLTGKGLWSDNDFWSCSLHWYPAHLHSVFMDALVRGGIPALLGLLGIIAWGARRAYVLAGEGEALWFMLVCFGVAGVIFDGDSAFSLLTEPRYEALILWVPLVIASARYTKGRRVV